MVMRPTASSLMLPLTVVVAALELAKLRSSVSLWKQKRYCALTAPLSLPVTRQVAVGTAEATMGAHGAGGACKPLAVVDGTQSPDLGGLVGRSPAKVCVVAQNLGGERARHPATSAVGVYQAVPDGEAREALGVVQVELGHQAHAVSVDRVHADAEPLRDRLVGVAFGDELQHLALPT